ncbi:MAG: hypothetical protein M3R70_06085 [Actinomycetota bacterium]|nr:hypothetical protein [Actinomycetota bacterium]
MRDRAKLVERRSPELETDEYIGFAGISGADELIATVPLFVPAPVAVSADHDLSREQSTTPQGVSRGKEVEVRRQEIKNDAERILRLDYPSLAGNKAACKGFEERENEAVHLRRCPDELLMGRSTFLGRCLPARHDFVEPKAVARANFI